MLKDSLVQDTLIAQKKLGLLNEFPDLKEVSDRWGHKCLVSEFVNEKADNFSCVYSCGCCTDSSFNIMPYVIREGLEIHSIPSQICIGHKEESYYENKEDNEDAGGEFKLVPNWKNTLLKHKISNSVIKKFSEFAKKNNVNIYED